MRLPPYYHFRARGRIISGHDALDELPGLVSSLGGPNPMIITDTGIVAAGLLQHVLDPLHEAGLTAVEIFDDVPPDSDVETVRAAAERYHRNGCSCIIAVGGGSVLDTAKGVNIIISNEGAEEHQYDIRTYSGAGAVHRELGALIAVPTTSGTGSESTLVAVIMDHSDGRKLLFTSDALIPCATVLDPRMSLSLPAHLTAATGMDALTHAVEAYTGLGKNPVSDGFALQAIDLITANLFTAVDHPDDRDARLALAVGANLAGQAFSNSMVGLVHTVGHTVGSVCGIHHGLCMSILLPYGLEYSFHKISGMLDELAPIICRDESASAEDAIDQIHAYNAGLCSRTGGSHAVRFHDVAGPGGRAKMKPDHIPVIAGKALGDGSHFYAPEQADYEDYKRILEASYWGYRLDRELIVKGHQ